MPTVYCQGFLTHSASPSDFASWSEAHQRLQSSELKWGSAHGFEWRTGAQGDEVGRGPIPFVSTSAAMAWWIARRARATPSTVGAALLGDALANAARVYRQFRAAEAGLSSEAMRLARTLTAVSSSPASQDAGGYRLVSHSLGCRLVLEALPLVPPAERPVEVHLLAAACTEQQARPCLEQLITDENCATEQVIVYFSSDDEVLTTAFRYLVASPRNTDAIGAVPLSRTYRGVRCVDASPYTAEAWPWVHAGFPRAFDRMAIDAILRREMGHGHVPRRTHGRLQAVAEQARWLRAAVADILVRTQGKRWRAPWSLFRKSG
jgi:hypothetical protein